jgi:chemotaxis protein CheD
MAIILLLEKIAVIGAPFKEYQVKLFGGGSMFPHVHQNKQPQLGLRNIQAVRRLAKLHGFTCLAEHLGGIGYRNVTFELWSGEVWVKHNQMLAIPGHDFLTRSLG